MPRPAVSTWLVNGRTSTSASTVVRASKLACTVPIVWLMSASCCRAASMSLPASVDCNVATFASSWVRESLAADAGPARVAGACSTSWSAIPSVRCSVARS